MVRRLEDLTKSCNNSNLPALTVTKPADVKIKETTELIKSKSTNQENIFTSKRKNLFL